MARGQLNADRSADTIRIKGKLYTGILRMDTFCLQDNKGHVLLRQRGDYFGFEFKDFNKDGYKDIELTLSGNTPEVLDLFLFIPSAQKFQRIRDFDYFPSPQRINGTHYFYSYHKSGCADMDWDSDLFYIHNGKAVALGNISGRGCEIRLERQKIYIRCIRKGTKRLINILPMRQVQKYHDGKWGFIAAYWTKNYKRFI